MSYLSPGLLQAYNSLTDKHLIGYFNNTRIRRHLRRAGLITRSGRIVPEKEYRQKLIHRTHQRHVRECLAQAIFHKVLDMERSHQTEIKKRLEEFARRERVYKIKVERSKRHDEDFIPMLSPRPPTGPRGSRTQHSGPEGELSESSESPGSSRPNTAPGKMQRPVRLKPIDRNSTTASVKRTPPSSRNQDSSNDTDQPLSLDRDTSHWATRDFCSTVSPYRLPVINNLVTPVPPLTRKRDRAMKGPLNGTRGRRLRPTTAPNVPANTEGSALLRTSVQSKVTVAMVYFGRSVHLSHDLEELGDEVKVFQQHCGGENLCVYNGRLREGETFQFISRRHRGFPFSLTFYLNGLQGDRLSSCCEFKHRKGSRLGGRHGHFGFFNVDGAQPCYRCIIAMGLDKKPTPPPKRVSEDTGSSPAIKPCPDGAREPAEVQEYMVKRKEPETESTQPDSLKTEEDTMQNDQPRDDYEEDFEADDEGPADDGGEEADGKSASPTNEGKKEDEIQDAPDGELAEQNKHPDREAEDEDKADQKKTCHPGSYVSSGDASSRSGSDAEDSEIEADTREDDAAETPKAPEVTPRAEPEPEVNLPMETSEKEQQVEDAEMTEMSSLVPPEPAEAEASPAAVEAGTEARDSTGASRERTELEVSESTEVEAEAVGEGGSVAEGEPERAKSVQEKLAEAILNETQSSPEPELSDTSTEEEEEESAEKTQQDTTVVESETSIAFSLPQLSKEQDKESEEIARDETGLQASEERGPPENVDKQATDEQAVVTEEPGVENEVKEEPVDDSSKAETPAKPESEEKEEVESKADEAPCVSEAKAEKKEQEDEEDAKEQTEKASTAANEPESSGLENKEGIAEEVQNTKDSEASPEEQEKDGENNSSENTAETVEGEPAVKETVTEVQDKTSVAATSEVAQFEEPSADDTKRQGTPDDQYGAAESDTANVDDTIAHADSTEDDAIAHGDSTEDDADKNTKQEPDSSIVETSEKPSEKNNVAESGENCGKKLADSEKVDSDEIAVNDGNDPQNTEEKDNAKDDYTDEGHKEVEQDTAENGSVRRREEEEKDVDELRQDQDKTIEKESVEAAEEQAKVEDGEQPEGDKVEEEAKEDDLAKTGDTKAENEIKDVDGDAKSCMSDDEKENSVEDKNKTEYKVVDGDERNSVSEGEKKEPLEGEGKEKLDGAEDEGKQAKAETAKSTDETITEKETTMDDCGQGGDDEVKEEEDDKLAIGQVDERKVEVGQAGNNEETKQYEEKGKEMKEERKDGAGERVNGTENENPDIKVEKQDEESESIVEGGGTKNVDGVEEDKAAAGAGKVNEDSQAGDTLKDDGTDTKVEEAGKVNEDSQSLKDSGTDTKVEVAGKVNEDSQSLKDDGTDTKVEVAGKVNEDSQSMKDDGTDTKVEVAGKVNEDSQSLKDDGTDIKVEVAGKVNEDSQSMKDDGTDTKVEVAGKVNEDSQAGDTLKDDGTDTKVEEAGKVNEDSQAGDTLKDDTTDTKVEEVGKVTEDSQAGDTLKDDGTDTKVEEVEKAEDVGKSENESCDGERRSSGVGEADSSRKKADESGGDGTRSEERDQRKEDGAESANDVNGEEKDDVMEFNVEETIVHDIAMSGDGAESEHGEKSAEVMERSMDEVMETKAEQTGAHELAVSGVETEAECVVINGENGEEITASDTNGNKVKEKSELEGQGPQQIIDEEQRDSADREQEIEETRNSVVDLTDGEDTERERKRGSDGSVEMQVKVEDEKVKEKSELSGADSDDPNRHNAANQETDAAKVDRQAEETSTDIEPFNAVQEPESPNTAHTSSAVTDAPCDSGGHVETKGHESQISVEKEDTSTKEGQTNKQEQDGTEKEHKDPAVNGEQSGAERVTSPLHLAHEKGGDLVSKWVNLHQSSRYFQTYIEPLDDIKETSSKGEVDMNGPSVKGEGSQVTNMPESDTQNQISERKEDYCSPPMSTHTEDKQETAVEDFVMETTEEKTESDVRSKHSNDESVLATKDMLEERQDKEIRDLRLTVETKYATKETASTATKDRENPPYEQGVVSSRVINLIAITKNKDDSKLDSESSSESVSHAKTDNSVHSGHAEDTTEKKQQLRFEERMQQSLSRDRLSAFSVEDSRLFGPTTYPRLATAHPEQSY